MREDNTKTQKKMAEAVLVPLDKKANPKSKDGVFCDLFKDPKYLIQLYYALHPEDDTASITDITLVTLENQMLRTQYNDLGFIIGNRLMILIEEQTLWTLNILIRILMYLGETYQRYIKNNGLDVYGTKKVEFPRPELYVLCPKGAENLPEEITLSHDVWKIENPDQIFVDVKAKVIKDGKQGDIINQYVNFSRVFDEQVLLYGKTEKAVQETIRICTNRNVLSEYLVKEEVPEIMFANLSEEEQREYVYSKGREEGIFDTLANLVRDKLLDIAEAAKRVNMSTEEFIVAAGLK
ncbi:MAG: hypothetical protein IJI57_01655 [Flexilinea sp.]|nr:hypothetical protein [Flexilinea sp.]